MNLYIVRYSHRHGHDVWPVFATEAPTEDEVIAGLDEFEPEREEYIEIYGPFRLPVQLGRDEDNDIKIDLPNGENMRFDSTENNPNGVSFVRFYDGEDETVGWASEEWEEAPQEVMGAILGKLCEALKGNS